MLITLIAFFAVLGILVLVHELGHFITARRAGIKVEEFGLGLPPRMFGFYKSAEGNWRAVGLRAKEAPGTIWSLNWIPLGGFVKIKGEDGSEVVEPDSFGSKSIWQRIMVLSAGVTMNVILAAVILSISLAIGSPQVIDDGKLSGFAKVSNVEIKIFQVLEGSPAAQSGIEVADTILAVDDQTFTKIAEFQEYFDQKVGQTVNLKIERKSEVLEKQVVPQILAETQRAGMGVALLETGLVSYPWYLAPVFGVWETLKMIGGVIFGFFLIIKSLVVSQELIGDVYGPVGIAGLVGDAARLGFLYLMQFTAALSVIIAVINFLPFPALDGGRVAFLLLEAVRKKPVNPKLEALMHNIGFALLMILVVIVTFRDIARVSAGFLNWWNSLGGMF
ncbi:MAG: site-2 protease family protein [Candidatus Buchananbacteria bacterium]|nr:site-2 protease family protein [Candidatus Buchananbacteria bacterium]